MKKQERVKKILEALAVAYPDANCTLDFRDPFELMVGAILATQSTDVRVNLILPELLGRFPDPAAMAAAEIAEVEPLVQSVGLFRAKAKNLVGAARRIVDVFDGAVPREMDELLSLPGVGRKIANLIRGDAYGIPGVVVDTHCGRIARRLGLTKSDNPAVVERDLEKILPPSAQISFGHYMVALGREYCRSRNPLCDPCPLAAFCPSAGSF